MDMINPFHAGELEAQARAGVGNVAEWAAGFIRDYLPEQHREFHTSLPFLVVAGGDMDGQTWVTLLEGPDGFATSPNQRQIDLASKPDETDPLAKAFQAGTKIGVLGIELANRRRNRFSGHIRPADGGFSIDIGQTFGNCPQHIHQRTWQRVPRTTPPKTSHGNALTPKQAAQIKAADTLFIGSGQLAEGHAAARGYDASHRGGEPGFVRVIDNKNLQFPDYAGNNFFNTIGNLITNPHVGLLFVDFETGGLLHITGRAQIDWDTQDDRAPRLVNIEIDAVIHRPQAVSLRWAKQDHLLRQLNLVRREKESQNITSFYFAPTDGRPLDPFEPGQHLPIEVQIPGEAGTSKRSYSLSGSQADSNQYRLSIKRDDKGLVSRYLHDSLQPGAAIAAQKPSGNFVIPCSNCPLVLVSAGVGLTPMLAMLHATAGQQRPVFYIHGARNGADHALRAETDALTAQNGNVQQKTFYSRPGDDDVLGQDYDVEGRISANDLLALDAGPNANYMICGPAAFMAEIRKGLEAGGVSANHIHIEAFGPAS